MADGVGSDSGNPAVRRVIDHGIGAEAADALGQGLAGSDLTSLLLDVMSRRASRRSARDIAQQYESDRFTRPAQVDPRMLLSMSLTAADSLVPDFELVETAPLVPLGTHSVISGISKNRVVSTIRSTEVAADPTVLMQALRVALDLVDRAELFIRPEFGEIGCLGRGDTVRCRDFPLLFGEASKGRFGRHPF